MTGPRFIPLAWPLESVDGYVVWILPRWTCEQITRTHTVCDSGLPRQAGKPVAKVAA